MDRDQAAALLGVATTATKAEVQTAFRALLRAGHPDAGGGPGGDMDRLRQARDLLLEPATTSRQPEAAAHRPRAQTTSGAGARTTRSAWPLRIVGTLIIGVLVAVASVAIWSLAAGVERTDSPVDGSADCVIVTPGEVSEVDCDAFGAQRVLSQLSGARQCGAGANSLVVGSTTWCLVPADS